MFRSFSLNRSETEARGGSMSLFHTLLGGAACEPRRSGCFQSPFLSPVVVVQLLSCVRLFCDPMDCRLRGSSDHGISQAKTLEWVAFPPPGDLPNPGIESMSPALAGRFSTTREAQAS